MERFLLPVLITAITAMLAWIIIWKILIRTKRRQGITISFPAQLIFFTFYIYIVIVLSLTVFPLPFERFKTPQEDGINVTPILNTVRDLLQILSTKPEHETEFIEHSFQNLFGNIILFMPLGMFLPILSNRYHYLSKVIVIALACSISIELTQLVIRQFKIYRSVDIDDVILNTSGAILGYVLINKFYFKQNEDD